MITFGEIINYDDAQYVYLAATEEIIYLAKVLNNNDAARINNLCAKRQSDGQASKVENAPIYCFVILSTDGFKDRMAHCGQPGHDFNSGIIMDSVSRLNETDLKEIQHTINIGPVPLELKELIKNIEL